MPHTSSDQEDRLSQQYSELIQKLTLYKLIEIKLNGTKGYLVFLKS